MIKIECGICGCGIENYMEVICWKCYSKEKQSNPRRDKMIFYEKWIERLKSEKVELKKEIDYLNGIVYKLESNLCPACAKY